jgi:hypothetical protein
VTSSRQTRGPASAKAGSTIRVLRIIAGPDQAFLLAARLTLFVLLFHAGDGWYFQVPITVLVVAGVLWRRALYDPLYWLAVSTFLAFGNYLNWDINDNHQYLINYWCLAIACCLGSGAPEKLRGVARALIGLTMSLAVVWKGIAPDFLNGAFFQSALLNGSRFEPAVEFFTGLSGEVLAANRAQWAAFLAPDSTLTEIWMRGSAEVLGLARLLSWWGVGIEAVLAVLFLAPLRGCALRWGHILLLVFVFSTYGIANVVGFGWILCVLGIAACDRADTNTRTAYLAAFAVVFLFKLPLSQHFRFAYDVTLPFGN